MAEVRRPSLRERNRMALRRDITDAAFELFRRQGFATTTIDQIAEAAGVSRRSFFHHFPTKEDVVLGDTAALGERLQSALQARPPAESAWTALSEAFRVMDTGDSSELRLATAQMYRDNPSLRARHLEKHLRWQELLAPEIGRRLGIPVDDAAADPRPRALIAAALSCLDVAIDAWLASEGARNLEELFFECVATIRS